MVTEPEITPEHFDGWDDDTLINRLGSDLETIALLKAQSGRLERELQRRMEERGAREVYHPNWTCKLVIPSPDYDIGKLRGKLGEIIPPEVWDKGFTEAYEKTAYVEAAFDMRVVKGWATAYGGAVKEIVEAAMLPKPPRVKVERRE